MKFTGKTLLLATVMIAGMINPRYSESGPWQPPVGIPAPPFGITETAPARPANWDNQVVGYYYIDETSSSSTDTANSYGSPQKPRKTIPLVLPAGSYVELHGTYTKDHTNSKITFQGTIVSPCWIRGLDNGANRPVATRKWTVQGSYGVVENIHFDGSSGSMAGVQTSSSVSTNHIVFRWLEIEQAATGNTGILFQGSATDNTIWATNCVAFQNNVHNIGDPYDPVDSDHTCVMAFARASNIWMLENEIHYSSGVGAYTYSGLVNIHEYPHHVYIGKNHIYQTRQSGVTAKGSSDIIASENHIHDIFDRKRNPPIDNGVASEGKGMAIQYSPERVWFINNNIHDCFNGIYSAANAANPGVYFYVIGNNIWNIRFNPGTGVVPLTNSSSYAAISIGGGVIRYVINNTLDNVMAGVHIPSSNFEVHIEGNIFGSRNNIYGRDIVSDAIPPNSTVDYNLFRTDDNVKVVWGSGGILDLIGFKSAKSQCINCLNASPTFTNAAEHNYTLLPSSPAINKNYESPVYQTFYDTYGIDIRKDISGAARPGGTNFTIGAYEFVGAPSLDRRPMSVVNLQIH